GAVGIFWAVAWFLLYDSPWKHRALKPEERAAAEAAREAAPKTRPSMLSIVSQRAFWAIAIPRFLAEPAWQTFSFFIPLYLAHERGMDLKQIAIFAWLPFLAADAGGIFAGYLPPFLMKFTRTGLLTSRALGVALGALLMIGPACIGLAADPYVAIALLCIGGFAHQTISVLVNTLTSDVFPREAIARGNGLVGMAGWTGGLLFTLLVGALADRIGYAPLFALLGVFDILG